MYLQAAEYLFKYIVQSRMLYAAATAAQAEEEFRCSVHELFKSIHLFLSHQSKGISPVTHTQVRNTQAATILTNSLVLWD